MCVLGELEQSICFAHADIRRIGRYSNAVLALKIGTLAYYITTGLGDRDKGKIMIKISSTLLSNEPNCRNVPLVYHI